MNTPAHATLTWRSTWPLETSVEECVMTVNTTPWDAAVSSADPFTTSTRRETSAILTSVNVSVERSPSHLNSLVVIVPLLELTVWALDLAVLYLLYRVLGVEFTWESSRL